MTRLLLNGSPRGKDANSRKILSWIAQGLEQAGIDPPAIVDVAPDPMRGANIQAFLAADEVVFAFPLYTDSMPGLVKGFLEAIALADKTRLQGKRVAFVIQSGFPEGIHTEALGAYLARVCERLGFIHLGTLRKGGVESIRMLPPKRVAKIQALFVEAGRGLGQEGRFSPELIRTMASPRTFGWTACAIIHLLSGLGLINYYWNHQLKKHGAYHRRFDAPYLAGPISPAQDDQACREPASRTQPL
ncbi:MAG: NAD(P)H-dependent oxidoreductase [Polyangia bacterium]